MAKTRVRDKRRERNGSEKKQFWIDVPFQKSVSASTGDIVLKGYASTWTEDRDGETVEPTAFDDSLPDYLANNPILLWQHCQEYPLGVVTSAKVDEKGLYVTAVVTKPQAGEEAWRFTAYEQVKRGVVRTFSIGGFMWREVVMPLDETANYDGYRIIIYKVELFEISVVSVPANPESLYSAAVKSMTGAAGGPILTRRARNQMAELIGMREVTDNELKAMTEDEREGRYEELDRLYRRSGLVPPDRDSWVKAVEVSNASSQPQVKLIATLGPLLHTLGFVKAGRAISNTNESKLREAISMIEEVLSAIEPAKPDIITGTSETEFDSGTQDLVNLPAGVEQHPDPRTTITRTVRGIGQKAKDKGGSYADPEAHEYKGNGGPCEDCGYEEDSYVHEMKKDAPKGASSEHTSVAVHLNAPVPTHENDALKELGLAIAALSGEVRGMKAQPAQAAQAPIVVPAPNISVQMPEMKFGGPQISVGQPEIHVPVELPDVNVQNPPINIDVRTPDVNVDVKSPDVNVDVHPPSVEVHQPDITVESSDVNVDVHPPDVTVHPPQKRKSVKFVRNEHGEVIGAEQADEDDE